MPWNMWLIGDGGDQSMMVLKEKKEMEDEFKRAQKPWVKVLTKVNKAKQDYHNACKNERSAANQERNATGDNAVSAEQVLFSCFHSHWALCNSISLVYPHFKFSWYCNWIGWVFRSDWWLFDFEFNSTISLVSTRNWNRNPLASLRYSPSES